MLNPDDERALERLQQIGEEYNYRYPGEELRDWRLALAHLRRRLTEQAQTIAEQDRWIAAETDCGDLK